MQTHSEGRTIGMKIMPRTRCKTVSGKRSTKKQGPRGPVETEDTVEMSNEEPDKDVDVDPVLLPETSDEEKNTEDVMSKDQPSSSRDAELFFMAQKIKALEEERDFLRQTVKTLSDNKVSREEVCLEDTGPESTDSDDTPSSSSTLSSSDDGHPRKRSMAKRRKKSCFLEKNNSRFSQEHVQELPRMS
ncbi:hypothetical protein MHYP_G00344040 [Metynnis hypsauchen]